MTDHKINGGSPVGPGFVVYERGPGLKGYDLEMAKQSVGKGWRPLLEELFKYMENNKKYGNPGHEAVIIQVKEKFGILRIYAIEGDEYFYGVIAGLELASSVICEACGQPGKLRKRAWLLTLCDSCHERPRPLQVEGL